MTRRLIGLCGWAGSGKDTIAEYLCKHHGFSQTAFGNKLRELLSYLNPYIESSGKYYNELVEEMGYENAKRKYYAIRQWLVKLGHGSRRILNNDSIWIKACDLETRCKIHGNVVVSDVRYKNEAMAIKELGGEIWYVFRPTLQDAASPEEKESIYSVPYDQLVVNDSDIESLCAKVSSLL